AMLSNTDRVSSIDCVETRARRNGLKLNNPLKKVHKVTRDNGNVVEFVWSGDNLVAHRLESDTGYVGKIEYEYSNGKVSISKFYDSSDEEKASWNYYYDADLLVRQEVQFQTPQGPHTATFNLRHDSQGRPTGYSYENSHGGSGDVDNHFVWDGENVANETNTGYFFTYNSHPNPFCRIWMGCERFFPNPHMGPIGLRDFLWSFRDILFFSKNLIAKIGQEPGPSVNYANYAYDSDGYPTRIAFYDGTVVLTIEYAE
nr:hypothetical protein [Bacteroidaceae bacterium]